MKRRSKDISLIKMCVPTGYTCALQRDILYQGKMFVSDNWICFHSKVFGKDTKVLVSYDNYDKNSFKVIAGSCFNPESSGRTSRFRSLWCQWRSSKKLKLHYWCQMRLLLKLQLIRWEGCLQNHLVFQFDMNMNVTQICLFFSSQHVFVSFLSRNTTYKFLKSICVHLEVNKWPRIRF